MSEEEQPLPALPHWVGDRGFISEAEWRRFDTAAQAEWTQFAGNVTWLLNQPQFRSVMFSLLNEPRFFGTDQDPRRSSTEDTYHAIGVQHAGRMLRLVLQSVSPRMWMRLMHDAFNALSRTPQDGSPKE